MSDIIADKETVVDILTNWNTLLLAEPKASNLTPLPLDYQFDNVEPPNSHIIFLYSVGGKGNAIVMGVAKHMLQDQYQPCLVVTEKNKRSHGPGIGHRAHYRPKQDGNPNFELVIANAISRDEEIGEELSAKAAEQKERARVEATVEEDLDGVRVPQSLMISRRTDGSYQVHLAATNMAPNRMRALCRLLTEEDIPALGVS